MYICIHDVCTRIHKHTYMHPCMQSYMHLPAPLHGSPGSAPARLAQLPPRQSACATGVTIRVAEKGVFNGVGLVVGLEI